MLPLSHDEVVHGKGSLLGRMPGDNWQRFANLRAYFGFMWTHPGKKLLFMGGEFGQDREWNHDGALDWRRSRIRCTRACDACSAISTRCFEASARCMHATATVAGFRWVVADDRAQSVLAWLRMDPDGVRRCSWCAISRPCRGTTTAWECRRRAVA